MPESVFPLEQVLPSVPHHFSIHSPEEVLEQLVHILQKLEGLPKPLNELYKGKPIMCCFKIYVNVEHSHSHSFNSHARISDENIRTAVQITIKHRTNAI